MRILVIDQNNDTAMGAATHLFGIELKSMARQLPSYGTHIYRDRG